LNSKEKDRLRAYCLTGNGQAKGVCDKQEVIWPALRQDKTMAELCKEFELHPTQINYWKRQLLDGAAAVFGSSAREGPVDMAPLHAKIGQLALENDFLESALTKAELLSAKR
jgi:transposase-like protein